MKCSSRPQTSNMRVQFINWRAQCMVINVIKTVCARLQLIAESFLQKLILISCVTSTVAQYSCQIKLHLIFSFNCVLIAISGGQHRSHGTHSPLLFSLWMCVFLDHKQDDVVYKLQMFHIASISCLAILSLGENSFIGWNSKISLSCKIYEFSSKINCD